jgi:hypothetical protein
VAYDAAVEEFVFGPVRAEANDARCPGARHTGDPDQ